VTNISPHGFWLLLDDREVFVPFRDFPWFERASVHDIARVERPSPHHLHWPELDVDLAVESLEHPERYPLVSRVTPARGAGSGASAGKKGGRVAAPARGASKRKPPSVRA
jgi:hypothetical protein